MQPQQQPPQPQVSPNSSSTISPPYQYSTDAYLAMIGHKRNLMVQRVVPLHSYFTEDYQQRKGCNYEQSIKSANRALSGTW